MLNRGVTSNVINSHLVYDEAEATIGTSAEKIIECAGAKGVMLSITAAEVAGARAMTLTIDVSNDNGETFHNYKMLIDNLATSNSQTLTRVASKVRNANGTDILWFTPEAIGGMTHFKVKMEKTNAGTAGKFTVVASVSF